MKYGKILVTISVAAAANSFAWTYETYGAKFSADGTKVAYVLDATGGPYIYTANADGTGKVRLELKGGLWGEPYFSPDGKKVAFITNEDFLNGNIFITDVAGENLRQLTKYGDAPFKRRYWPDQRTGVLDEGLTFSPDGRKVLYCSEEFGSQDIFAVNVDGTGKTRLTDFVGYDESAPFFLPGGDEVIFKVKGPGEKRGIWIMNADGSGKKRLHFPAYAELLAVSPDGKKFAYEEMRRDEYGTDEFTTYVSDLAGSSQSRVAFAEKTGGISFSLDCWFLFAQPREVSFSPDGNKVLYGLGGSVYVVNADGTGRTELTAGWYSASNPVYFNDGAKIAFLGRRGSHPSSVNIYTLGADGSNLKLFGATEGMDVWDMVVSPTGDSFLLQRVYEDYGGQIPVDYYVVNADGTGLTCLTEGGRRFATGRKPDSGTFSSDGSKVAYVLNENGEKNIYTVNADGSGKIIFDLKGDVWGVPHFSPDGKKIAFITDVRRFPTGNVFLVDVDGTNPTQVTAYGDDPFEKTDGSAPAIRTGPLDWRLAFSPDGRKILYCSAELGSKDIFSVNVNGTGKTRLTDLADREESGPAFLAGGKEIIFTVKDKDWFLSRVSDIWKMNADGSGKKRVPVPGVAVLKAVSPDGKKIIAFGDYPDEENGFGPYTDVAYVAALDGSSRFMLGEEDYWPSIDYSGSFSPDGKNVLYSNDHGIWIIDADGSGRKNLTLGLDLWAKGAFFAAGDKIAFVVERPWPPYRRVFWVMDADGSNAELFKATEGMDVSDFVVSPTGDRFLILGDNCGEANPSYFVVNADGSGLVRLTGE